MYHLGETDNWRLSGTEHSSADRMDIKDVG